MASPRSWTDDQLVAAAHSSRSLAEVIRKLGLPEGGGAYRTVRPHLARLGVEVRGPERELVGPHRMVRAVGCWWCPCGGWVVWVVPVRRRVTGDNTIEAQRSFAAHTAGWI